LRRRRLRHGATVTAGSAAGNVGSGGSVIGDPDRTLAGRLHLRTAAHLHLHVRQERGSQSPIGKQATIIGANTATPFVMMGSGPGTYTFILTLTDSAANTSTNTDSLILQ